MDKEKEEDIKTRIEGFRTDYIELTKKWQIDLNPSIQMVDTKYLPVPAPLQNIIAK